MNDNESQIAGEPIELLCHAAATNDTQTIHRLLNENPSLVNERRPNHIMYPVDFAVEKGNLDALQLLVEKNANLNTMAIILLALKQPNDQIIDFLNHQKIFDDAKITMLHIKAARDEVNDNDDLERWCVSGNLDVEGKPNVTPLILAVLCKKFDCAELLIRKGASKEKLKQWRAPENLAKNFFYQSMSDFLLDAVREGNIKACQFLIKHNIVEKEVVNLGLVESLKNGHTQIADLFMTHGGSAKYLKNWKDASYSSYTMLHIVCIDGDLKTVKYMVEKKLVSHIDAKANNNRTALLLALMYQHIDIAKYLLIEGASKEEVRDWKHLASGDNLLFHAIENDWIAVFRFLIQYNIIDINTHNSDGVTALARASILERKAILNCWIDVVTMHFVLLPSFKLNQETIISGRSITMEDESVIENGEITKIRLKCSEKKWEVFRKYVSIYRDIIKKLDAVKMLVECYHKTVIDYQITLKKLYHGSSNIKYPGYDWMMNIQLNYFDELKSLIETFLKLQLVEEDMSEVVKGMQTLMIAIDVFGKKFTTYRREQKSQLQRCENWIKSQEKSRARTGSNIVIDRAPTTHSVPEIAYFLQQDAFYVFGQLRRSTCETTNNIRAYSMLYYILLALDILEHSHPQSGSIALVKNRVVRDMFTLDSSYCVSIKLFIKNELVSFFACHPDRQPLPENKLHTLEALLTALPCQKKHTLSETSTMHIEGILHALYDIRDIMSHGFHCNDALYPHHMAAIKLLLLHLAYRFAALSQLDETIPETVGACFKFQGEDLTSVKHHILNQSRFNEKSLINFIKNMERSIDETLSTVEAWEDYILNNVSQLMLAPQFFKSTSNDALSKTVTHSIGQFKH